MSTAVATPRVPFFKRVEDELKKILHAFGQDEPKVAQVAAGTLAIVTPLIVTVLTISGDAPAAALVPPIVSRIQYGLAALTTIVQSNGADKATAKSVVDSLISELSTFEQVVGIKDDATKAKIGTIAVELQAIAAALPAAKAVTLAPAPAPAAS